MEVTRRLLDYLLSGGIEPGSKLPSERELVQLLGIGRSAIRDGLKPLVALGILDVRPGDGTYLKAVHSDILPEVVEWGILLGEKHTRDLIEARLPVELGTVRLAAQRRDEAAIARLEHAVADMEAAMESDDGSKFVKADLAFHLSIADVAGNSVLRNMLGSIQSLLSGWMSRVVAVDLTDTFREHPPILEGIKQQDPDEAARCMEAHLVAATARLYRIVDARGEGIGQPARTDRAGRRASASGARNADGMTQDRRGR